MLGALEGLMKMQLPTASASEIRAWIKRDACRAWAKDERGRALAKSLIARHVGRRRINALQAFRLAKRWRREELRGAGIWVACHLLPIGITNDVRGYYTFLYRLNIDARPSHYADRLNDLIARLEGWEKAHA